MTEQEIFNHRQLNHYKDTCNRLSPRRAKEWHVLTYYCQRVNEDQKRRREQRG